MRDLRLEDLDLSIVPAFILRDRIWQECMRWATQGRGKEQRYGALCIRGREILGGGRSRLLGRNEPFPYKTSYFLHAESAALGAALLNLQSQASTNSVDVSGATIYWAGFLVKDRIPLIRRAGFENMCSCVRCPALLTRFGVNLAIMTEHGWNLFTGEENLFYAKKNAKLIRERNLSTTEFRRIICLSSTSKRSTCALPAKYDAELLSAPS
jgi:hypothetical protein